MQSQKIYCQQDWGFNEKNVSHPIKKSLVTSFDQLQQQYLSFKFSDPAQTPFFTSSMLVPPGLSLINNSSPYPINVYLKPHDALYANYIEIRAQHPKVGSDNHGAIHLKPSVSHSNDFQQALESILPEKEEKPQQSNDIAIECQDQGETMSGIKRLRGD